jgi:hypothetical protein
LSLPILIASRINYLSLGHDRECRTAMVTYRGDTFPRNDVESELGASALRRFISSEILDGFDFIPPIAGLDEMTVLEEMLTRYPHLMSQTSFCFWGNNCGRCGKCLRYHLAQRLFLERDLLWFGCNPLAVGACPELDEALVLPRNDRPLLFQDQTLLCIGLLQQRGRIAAEDTALTSISPATQSYIDDLLRRHQAFSSVPSNAMIED